MNLFEKFLHILEFEVPSPSAYGIFHIVCLILTVAASAFLVWRFRDASDKTVRRLLLGVWVVLVVLEVYKQLVYAMDVENGVATWDYAWYAFPFQFCSTPLYALPFIIFLKDGWVRRAFMAYFATFSLFAGLAVMIYPGDVFVTSLLGIDLQTMIHHGSQVVLGIFLVAYNRRRLNLRYFAESLLVFCAFAAVAMILNVGVHHYLVSNGMDDTFNMFFISPYHPCTLPILSDIYEKVPYAVFLVIYLLGFSLVSALVFGIEKGIIALIQRPKRCAQVSADATA